MMKRHSELSNLDIVRPFGGLHYSAVAKTCARLEVEIKGGEGTARGGARCYVICQDLTRKARKAP